jgi:hypothetical protein
VYWLDWQISKCRIWNIYGDYAQKNLMQYKYNDDNATYNDGSILINNQNIADSKVIINQNYIHQI